MRVGPYALPNAASCAGKQAGIRCSGMSVVRSIGGQHPICTSDVRGRCGATPHCVIDVHLLPQLAHPSHSTRPPPAHSTCSRPRSTRAQQRFTTNLLLFTAKLRLFTAKLRLFAAELLPYVSSSPRNTRSPIRLSDPFSRPSHPSPIRSSVCPIRLPASRPGHHPSRVAT